MKTDQQEAAIDIIEGLGGAENIEFAGNCETRIRVVLKDIALVNDFKLRVGGALATVKINPTHLHVVVGRNAPDLAEAVRTFLNTNITPERARELNDPFENGVHTRIFDHGDEFEISSPVEGEAVDISEVPDEVFADNLLGLGVAIIPSRGEIFAPDDAVVDSIVSGGRGITLITKSGVELLIHVGTAVVKLSEDTLKINVTQGQSVSAGDKLVEFDVEKLRNTIEDVFVPVIVCNPADFFAVKFKLGLAAAVKPLILLTEKISDPSAPVKFEYVIKEPAGLHARPAGLLTKVARSFHSKIEITTSGKTVDAASIFDLLGLVAKSGDLLEFTISGEDQADAHLAIERFLSESL